MDVKVGTSGAVKGGGAFAEDELLLVQSRRRI